MPPIKSVKELDVANKTVLLRAGFDVPMKDGKVVDDFRIYSILESVNYLVKNRCRVIIIAHQGRPKDWDLKFSLEPVANRLAEILNRKFIVVEKNVTKLPEYSVSHLHFLQHNIYETDLREVLGQTQPGDIAVLENLRFYPGEEDCDGEFSKKLASLADAYVNEAFANSHRDHASMTGIPGYLPAGAGFTLLKEITSLERVLLHPKRPFAVLMGGIKLADKAAALENLGKIADYMLLGGPLANLFLKVRGFEIGKSIWHEKNEEKFAKELWRNYREKIKLPLDVVVSTNPDGAAECVSVEKVKPHQAIYDIGPKTIQEYSKYLKEARTLIWSGPLGYVEKKSFAHGTFALARVFAAKTRRTAFGVVGGGDTIQVMSRLGMTPFIDHVSTGGGAMLDMLAGGVLPGIEILEHDTIQAVNPNYT